MFANQPNASTSRFVATACRRGTNTRCLSQHISFMVIPDSSLEYDGSPYFIQSGAVLEYIIKGFESHDKNRKIGQTFISVSPTKSAKPTSKAPKAKTTTLPSNKVMMERMLRRTNPEKDIVESDATVTPPETQEKSIKLHGPIINGAIVKLKAGKHNNTAESRAPQRWQMRRIHQKHQRMDKE